MFVHRLTQPVDVFDGLTPLPDWLRHASDHEARWALQAVLALADAASEVGWRGDMRHLPSVGVLLTPPDTTPYLVVKQDDNGTTFLITAADAAGITASLSTRVAPRDIGAWTHPTTDDIATITEHAVQPTNHIKQEPAF
jgi:hypothetical protein